MTLEQFVWLHCSWIQSQIFFYKGWRIPSLVHSRSLWPLLQPVLFKTSIETMVDILSAFRYDLTPNLAAFIWIWFNIPSSEVYGLFFSIISRHSWRHNSSVLTESFQLLRLLICMTKFHNHRSWFHNRLIVFCVNLICNPFFSGIWTSSFSHLVRIIPEIL